MIQVMIKERWHKFEGGVLVKDGDMCRHVVRDFARVTCDTTCLVVKGRHTRVDRTVV